MSVVIRLTQMGKKGERKFRVVVKEKRSRRDGKPVESLGWYEKRTDKVIKNIDRERFEYWLQKGAKPTATVTKLLTV
ncbi:MAG: 30S ribosomal protein S16 [Candidatus Levyibacteriota bacterium]|nr:MAG: 30S ribosomal protein S16 [Candidatus Levybacteria bacterium]